MWRYHAPVHSPSVNPTQPLTVPAEHYQGDTAEKETPQKTYSEYGKQLPYKKAQGENHLRSERRRNGATASGAKASLSAGGRNMWPTGVGGRSLAGCPQWLPDVLKTKPFTQTSKSCHDRAPLPHRTWPPGSVPQHPSLAPAAGPPHRFFPTCPWLGCQLPPPPREGRLLAKTLVFLLLDSFKAHRTGNYLPALGFWLVSYARV